MKEVETGSPHSQATDTVAAAVEDHIPNGVPLARVAHYDSGAINPGGGAVDPEVLEEQEVVEVGWRSTERQARVAGLKNVRIGLHVDVGVATKALAPDVQPAVENN